MTGLVIITGGGRGIGAATARLLAGRGWDVCVGFRDDGAAAERVAGACRATGAKAITVRADVAVEAEVMALFDRAEVELGPVRGLVNNAGVVAPKATVAELSGERIRRMVGVNVLGAFLCAREAVRRMPEGSAIVNVSSRAAVLGAAGEYVDYAASKAAVEALTTGLAKEVAARGIRVNAVRPGLIRTGIHASGGRPDRVAELAPTVPMGRGGTPEEVAATIAWLLSEDASYVTGSFVDVSGGR
ncbi:NAD(P)-dependent oxidoreductase [Prauserella marina]|uniref:NAD(P)-dependent dehydrogenase, short-chain alcohol dehydrogenase family n=1 Tax=Prauserella marina TaxID=530584 RepID=A0A222VTZ9_9PSEU|nr:SDR family oxidoreductase [Prauserella marina]ASR37399.1 NAD(P)-dependent oxidoreductase [Prauserella marina]PWV74726.1 NAD(P)-dependent dehydrogenase (short-subunit alcohol dehydrogenase family) [Prauserella marina]SDD42312.1 NAD(P)-dependent dehydrogenase, short-chain alcohol dehydrogenase family [Prauserella marina]